MILEITKLGEEILRQKAEPVVEVNDEIDAQAYRRRVHEQDPDATTDDKEYLK